jgi:hypothetical protein
MHLRNFTKMLRGIGDDAEIACREVRQLAKDPTTLNWIGASGDAFKEHIGKFPSQLDKVAHSHHMAADALSAYAGELEHAQSQADRALANGRAVYHQVQSLKAQLGTAHGNLSSLQSASAHAHAPSPDQVKAEARRVTTAQDHVTSLQSQLSGPEAQLEAAKRLADQAASLRETAADNASRAIGEATDAGIPPDSFWHKLGDVCATIWHGLVEVAKIVVAVGSIIALIIGGPIAWIVFAAALIVLADTLMKYSQGKASLWDVALAALSCIPMTKGLTTLADLKVAWMEGAAFGGSGLLGVGGHLLGAGLDAGKGLKNAAVALWEGRSAIPGLVRALPFTAAGKLASMATELRYGASGALTGFGVGFRDGAGIFGSFKSGVTEAAQGWRGGSMAADKLASQSARAWQGSGGYPGIDRWSDTVVPAGTQMESLHPKLTGFSMPAGTMNDLGGDSAAISRGVQVGPSDISPKWNILHNYRLEGVSLRFNADVPAATSHALANPQFGEGGLRQYFIPDVTDRIAAGDISVVDSSGNVVPVHDGFADLGSGQNIPLHNFDLPKGSPILTNSKTAVTANGVVTIVNGVVVSSVDGARVTAPSR